MYLEILYKTYCHMSLVIQGLTIHDWSGTNIFRNPIPYGEVSQDIDIFNTILIVKIIDNFMKGRM